MTTTATIPFFPTDLFDDEREVLLELLHEVATDPEQKFILGWRTAALERAIRDSVGAADAVACGSGTSALVLVLKAFGVGPGDEVVVPAYGCAPLAAAPVLLGATPVFADVDPRTLVVDPAEVESLITERTRVVMPAHMFSTMADMPALRRIATTAGVRLLEDSAVAQGGVLGGRAAGTWGDAGVYSFVQVKTFGMPGEGGMVVTGDPALGRAVRVLRNHGQDGVRRFVHHTVGWNSRFDEVMAAFQLHRLPGFPERLERRARIGDYYAERFAHLAPLGITPPPPGRDGRCFYVYSLLAERRDELRDHLLANGVGCHAYYPAPLPHQPAFAPHADRRRDWPNARRGCERSLAIPINPRLTDAQVEHVADQVCRFAERPR
ncbi:DegT/DnrJ/EryC1/StrS family aminotransferase [Actinosynnema mirum]|uniref:DegT/DnrJ/EryC1/StrS aminotransferase n=1 Tax=Actinosynnema mirum (strain ATCC 29888 / DSM 43827 / JCM 3225 / NBRC 14064 / NCIMB 13271 / NRRL B-12336 / IMRU 3971 / 101) TaxID=446462 RepID=C6WD94_ACTMD|nr:DegT/DnrJ/EryC1/StrS family aminotransferase [Actinosynnema mirum]ACU37713.1 DegT/DnrJ/EryC1/StrS aminotransferase [Actinosynnema mirum DSM 43827]